MSISKIMTLAALAAALVFIFGDLVENQEKASSCRPRLV